MPLSEHEQRLLEQMERALMAEDPKFATSLRHGSSGADRRRIVGGVIGALIGLGILLVGVSSKLTPVGVLGFIVMLAAVFLLISGIRHGASAKTSKDAPAPAASAAPKKQGKSGFMAKFEQRWQDRNRRDGRDV